MGAIGAWLEVIAGFFVLGATFIFSQPMFDFLFAVGVGMGGNAADLANTLDMAIRNLPIVIAIALIIHGFLQSTRSEDNSRYR